MTDEQEQRLIRLEEIALFQDRLLEELKAALTAERREALLRSRVLEGLAQRLDNLERIVGCFAVGERAPGSGRATEEEGEETAEVPPHYGRLK